MRRSPSLALAVLAVLLGMGSCSDLPTENLPAQSAPVPEATGVVSEQPDSPERPVVETPPPKPPSKPSDGPYQGVSDALYLAFDWLAAHQSPAGQWDCAGFSRQCKTNRCDGAGGAAFTPGVSGLALLAFLGLGETHQSGAYKDNVKRGLAYLKSIQDSEGCFGLRTDQHYQYNHGYAALAMTEAYGMTGSRMFKDSAQRGVDFVLRSQNPYLGWRYGVRDGDNDTSITTLMTFVLKSAQMSELRVDPAAFKGALAWIDRMTEPEYGRVGYQQRGGAPARTPAMAKRFSDIHSESLTAMGLMTRVFCGQDTDHRSVRKAADLVAKRRPYWDPDAGRTDLYYWYFGTLAMFHMQDHQWNPWREALIPALVDHQWRQPGRDEHGSWDPVGPWGPEGGRVASTALLALCLDTLFHTRWHTLRNKLVPK